MKIKVNSNKKENVTCIWNLYYFYPIKVSLRSTKYRKEFMNDFAHEGKDSLLFEKDPKKLVEGTYRLRARCYYNKRYTYAYIGFYVRAVKAIS